MESTNTNSWQSMQERISNTQKRKELIPLIKMIKKERLIVYMQLSKMANQPLDNLYAHKKSELTRMSDELKVKTAIYSDLLDKELQVLEEHLRTVQQQLDSSTTMRPDMEEYKASLERALTALQKEQDEILHDPVKTVMAHS